MRLFSDIFGAPLLVGGILAILVTGFLREKWKLSLFWSALLFLLVFALCVGVMIFFLVPLGHPGAPAPP